jgi:hypothetical protein
MTRLETPEAAEAAVTVTISVVAQVNLTRRQGSISYVHPVGSLQPTPEDAESPITLRFAAAGGDLLHEHRARYRLSSEIGTDDDRVGIVDAVIAVPASARSIELVVEGEVMDTFRAAAEPPVPRTMSLSRVDQDVLRIEGEGVPLERGQTFAFQASPDGGRTWQTVAVGLAQPSLDLQSAQPKDAQPLLIRVVSTNGFTSTVFSANPIDG